MLKIAEVLRLARDVVEALKVVHAAGLVFRDIRPTNIFFIVSGAALLTEALVVTSVNANRQTILSGFSCKSAAYSSPDEAESPASDIYSLGAVLYEALTGHPPYDFADQERIAHARQSEIPRPLREISPDVPERLERVILCCLDRSLDHRYADCDALGRALDWAMEQLDAPSPVLQQASFVNAPSAPVPIGTGVKDQRLRLWLGVGAFVIVVVVIALLALRGGN